jgi:small-conductance mechanosensitive channel
LSTPDDNKKTAQWVRWWTDSGHRVSAVIGAYLMVLGLLAFVWFASTLRDRLGDGGGLMLTFGSIFAALALVSVIVRAAIPGAKQFGDTPVPAGDFARQFDQIGFGLLLLAGALAAGLFVALASYLASRTGVLPGWLCVAGYVVAALQLAAALFFPFILFFLWVLVTAIVLVSRGARTTVTASTASSR